jgi:hypothetical protein
MSPEQIVAYVKRCNELRASAQARNKSLREESEKHGIVKEKAPRKGKAEPSKSSIDQAMALLLNIQKNT